MESFVIQIEHVVSILTGLVVVVFVPLVTLINKIGRNAADIEANKQMIEGVEQYSREQIRELRNSLSKHEEKCSHKYEQLYALLRDMQGDIREIKGNLKHASCLDD